MWFRITLSYQRKFCLLMLLSLACLPITAYTAKTVPIRVIESKYFSPDIPTVNITNAIKKSFDLKRYSKISYQIIYNKKHQPDHIIVYLFSRSSRKLSFARMNITPQYDIKNIVLNYTLTEQDDDQQPGIKSDQAVCPNPATQILIFTTSKTTPIYTGITYRMTLAVANYAKTKGLETVMLAGKDATRTNYLNYLTCPNLIANYYDGYGSNTHIDTIDGVISANDFEKLFNKQFKYRVVNIFTSSYAFEDPMQSTMIDTVQSQKFASGINDLTIGVSDVTGTCIMVNIIDGQSITESVKHCVEDWENYDDQWGAGGKGSDYLGG